MRVHKLISCNVYCVFSLSAAIICLMALTMRPSSGGAETRTYSETLLTEMLATAGNKEKFSGLESSAWTEVCHLFPYENNSRNLPKEFWTLSPKFSFKPVNWSIDEDQVGIVFMDQPSMSGKLAIFPRASIDRIDGPRCIARKNAYFALEKVKAPNKTYNRLNVLDVKD